MAITTQQIVNLFEHCELKYHQQDNVFILPYTTEYYLNGEGEHSLLVVFNLDEEGKRLALTIPRAFELPKEGLVRGKVLKIMMARQYTKRYIRYEFDPRDGEVCLGTDLILEDNDLAEQELALQLKFLLKEIEAIFQEIAPLLDLQEQVQQLESLYQQEPLTPQPTNRLLSTPEEPDAFPAVSTFKSIELSQGEKQSLHQSLATNAPVNYKQNQPASASVADAQSITIHEPAILFRISQSFSPSLDPQEVYNVTRGNWVLGERREKAEYGFAVFQGVVRQVYRIDRWEFSGIVTDAGRKRWFFEGEIAPEMQHYINGSVAHYFKRGEASPTKYLNC